MQQLWFAFVGIGFLMSAAGALLMYVGNELRTAAPVAPQAALPIDPEAERLLRRLYELQTRFDLHKVVISRDGTLVRSESGAQEVNLIEGLLGGNRKDGEAQRALEKLILEIPLTYLRFIPDSRWDGPYVLAVTPEGKAYLRARPPS